MRFCFRIICEDIPRRLLYVCYILRLLFNTALDNYEKYENIVFSSNLYLFFRPSADLHYSSDELSPILSDNKTLFPTAADSLIVHPGAVLCMLDLLPAIPSHADTHDTVMNYILNTKLSFFSSGHYPFNYMPPKYLKHC